MSSPPFLQIAPARQEEMLAAPLRGQLHGLYDRVPDVSCTCDRPGQCCELTEAEFADDFATMYPLYFVEYLNIVDYVQAHFDPQRQETLLDLREERPGRCPFLTDGGGCSIYPVRPMACRTYGVLSRAQVEETAEQARGELPATWIWNFLSTERYTVCPKTRTLEPEKVAAHKEAMVTFAYERELIQMGTEAGELDEGSRQALQKAAGLLRVTRWTWGGFNALLRSPGGWLKRNFAGYWKRAFLGE